MNQQAREVHELDCYDRWYRALARGEKTAEVRRLTRDYQRGDVLAIRNHDDPAAPALLFEVTHVLTGTGDYGLLPGFAVLSLRRIG